MPHFEPVIRLAFGRSSRPQGRPLSVSDVPADLILRAASPTQRQTLLVGLALSWREEKKPELLEALRRVAEEANATALQDVLEVMARSGSLGFVVESLSLDWLLALGIKRGVHVNDILATTDSVTERGLTRTEALRITENFEGTLDPATVRFRFTTGIMTMGAGALVLGNVIHVDPTDPRWTIRKGTTLNDRPDDDAWDSFNGVLLTHEPCHIWSYQHQGTRYAINSVTDQLAAMQRGATRNDAYTYTPDKGHFLEYGEEQRAMIVQDFVTAKRAKAKGDFKAGTMFAGLNDVDDTIAKTKKYVDQMRSMGPGQPNGAGANEQWIVCACSPAFRQDGGAQWGADQVKTMAAVVGREAQDALVRGVTTGDAGAAALGAAGVAAAVGASVLTREQVGYGAKSGGSALLDQAGLPRGVEVGRDGVNVSAKAAWDAGAPKPNELPVGISNPRMEWAAGVHRDVGDVRVDADGKAVVGFDGNVKSASVSARVEHDDVTVSARTGVTFSSDSQRVFAHVTVETEPVTASTGVDVTTKNSGSQTVTAHASVETRPVQLSAEGKFSRHAADAPLALDEATLSATVQPMSGVSVGADVVLVPKGLEELHAKVSAIGDEGSLSVSADATKLTTQPTYGATLTATEKKRGVAVSANVKTTPTTGETQGGVNISVPLPEPGKKKS
ncbi:MAG: hypothetical protein ACO1OB_33155 [Archangium sp.]